MLFSVLIEIYFNTVPQNKFFYLLNLVIEIPLLRRYLNTVLWFVLMLLRVRACVFVTVVLTVFFHSKRRNLDNIIRLELTLKETKYLPNQGHLTLQTV